MMKGKLEVTNPPAIWSWVDNGLLGSNKFPSIICQYSPTDHFNKVDNGLLAWGMIIIFLNDISLQQDSDMRFVHMTSKRT